MVDKLYVSTVVNLDIVHLVRVKDWPNVSTVHATTLQAQNYVPVGRTRGKNEN